MRDSWEGLRQFIGDETGVTAIEYALLGGLIAAVIVATVSLVGQNLDTLYEYVSAKVATVAAALP